MHRSRCALLVTLCIPLVLSLQGCSPPALKGQAAEDAILYYLGNARFGGPVRRLWPAGQQYVDRIMRHDRVLEAKTEALEQWTQPETLWPTYDPRWQDPEALKAHILELEQALEELDTIAGVEAKLEELEARTSTQPDETVATPRWTAKEREKRTEALEKKRKELQERQEKDAKAADEKKDLSLLTRAALLESMSNAINALPEDLEHSSEAVRQDFVNRVWNSLKLPDGLPRSYIPDLEARVAQRLALYRDALEQLGPATQPAAGGGAGLPEELADAHAALQQQFQDKRQRLIDRAAGRLPRLDAMLNSMDKREERDDYELMSSERAALRRRLERFPAQLRERSRAIEKDIAALQEKKSPTSQAQIAALQRWEREISAQHEELEKRIKELLGKDEDKR